MERLTSRRVIEAQSACQRVDMPPWPCRGVLDGPLDLLKQGQHRTQIARMARGHTGGKETTGGRFRDDTGFPATLRRAMALAFDHGGHGGIVGLDKCTMAQFLAWREPCGWLADVRRGVRRRAQRAGTALALGSTQSQRLCKMLPGLWGTGCDGLATVEEVRCGVANQRDKDAPLAPATAAKATQDFFALLLQALGLALELRGPPGALLGEACNQREGVF